MEFLDNLFGTELGTPTRMVIAFVAVLILIAITAWVIRKLSGGGGVSMKARQPRLGLIEATAVDAKRRLVLVRRDNTEHLILIGGPSDLVVESGIERGQRASARGDQRREGRLEAPRTAANMPASGDQAPSEPQRVTPPTTKAEPPKREAGSIFTSKPVAAAKSSASTVKDAAKDAGSTAASGAAAVGTAAVATGAALGSTLTGKKDPEPAEAKSEPKVDTKTADEKPAEKVEAPKADTPAADDDIAAMLDDALNKDLDKEKPAAKSDKKDGDSALFDALVGDEKS